MTSSYSESLVEQIHASGKQMMLAVTGGGLCAISQLLTVPGASASVLEAVVPYSQQALINWLDGAVDHACSEWTARAMAMAAFVRARRLVPDADQSICGVGSTASLATTRPKRGLHRLHVAWQSVERTVVVSCELAKGTRSRGEEEDIAAQLILAAVAEACGVESPDARPSSSEPLVRREKLAPVEWSELLLGQRQVCECHPGESTVSRSGGEASSAIRPKVLFPGAFHPFHTAHAKMAEVASRRIGAPVTFELSVANVDKPPLDFVEIDDRLQGLAGRQVWLTRASTFIEKAALAPGVTFVVGADTVERIAQPRYYGGDTAQRDAAITQLAERGCRFLVFGRQLGGHFRSLADLQLPPALAALCAGVPESEFRDDISSTELRGSG